MRPADGELYRRALRGIRHRTGVPLAFAGQLHDQRLVLSEFLGARTTGLRDLHVEPGKGVGGTVLERGRPCGVSDYRAARSITHDYDDPVLGEGIHATIAVPVATHGRVRGVLYAAVRSDLPLGTRAVDALVGIAGEVARELLVRDEVDQRLKLLTAAAAEPGPAGREQLRELHAELRGIAADVPPGPLHDRLRRACDRISALGGPPPDPAPVTLSPREIDVLSQIALGCSNAEAATRLAVRPETVKAYLRSAMSKLAVHNRYRAVLAARRLGLLP
ncbi:GAF domain-containing protein [Amycolatopsis suaedae]|uniref:GAF domain-containing protein n=1 Tax=Amycolatopsis suaedae TaxID=2510978 RepID=A0A4V2EL34_9PSEU|nr:GAF domain-containing protein [Amycolatopsis suaedae]